MAPPADNSFTDDRVDELWERTSESLRAHWIRAVVIGMAVVGIGTGVAGALIWSSHKPTSTTLLTTSGVDWALSLVGLWGFAVTIVALVIALREARLSASAREDAESAMLRASDETDRTRRLLLAISAGAVDPKDALNILAKIQPLKRLDLESERWAAGHALLKVGHQLGHPISFGEAFREDSDTGSAIILPTDSHGLWRVPFDFEAAESPAGSPSQILVTDGRQVVSAPLQSLPASGLRRIRELAALKAIPDAALLFAVDAFRRRSRGSQRFAIRDSAGNWWNMSVANRTGEVEVEMKVATA